MTGPFLKIRNLKFFWTNTIPKFRQDRVFEANNYDPNDNTKVNAVTIKLEKACDKNLENAPVPYYYAIVDTKYFAEYLILTFKESLLKIHCKIYNL